MTKGSIWVPHQGNSCTAGRILLVVRLLDVLRTRQWAMVIADQEFIGQAWCSFMLWKRIQQCVHIRENTPISVKC
ncbi:hypothetical protein ASF71_20445 [Deinococcus sp. Leaf326]|nr:hypothetical protein ASF71_20445 [Deinococcus sp. Leaf326]